MDNKHLIKKQIEVTSIEFDHSSRDGYLNPNVIGNKFENPELCSKN
jgi:hypothetical protein